MNNGRLKIHVLNYSKKKENQPQAGWVLGMEGLGRGKLGIGRGKKGGGGHCELLPHGIFIFCVVTTQPLKLSHIMVNLKETDHNVNLITSCSGDRSYHFCCTY